MLRFLSRVVASARRVGPSRMLPPILLGSAALLLGCPDVWEPMKPGQVCRDVGYAISSRSFECDGDAERATARYQAFLASVTCDVVDLSEPIDVYYDCVARINETTCEEVIEYGDDWDRYLDRSAACRMFLSPRPTADEPAANHADGGM